MSSLREALDAERAAFRKGPPCSIGTLLAELDPADRDDLNDALAEPADRLPTTFILRAVNAATGRSVGAQTLARHRAGACRCDRPS